MKSIVKQLDRVQLTDTKVKVVMTEKVLNQVKYLCNKIAAVEWSGILYYSIEGSIKDPKNLVCTLQTILPMHKGTGSYTEYSFDERVVDFMMSNDDAMEWKIAHIHSHNNMATFFSGTDMEELEENAPNHNFYLSFIVNNRMDFEAKVCFIAQNNEEVKVPFFAKDEDGNQYEYSLQPIVDGKKKLIIYDCDIETPELSKVDDSFIAATDKIIKDAVPVYVAPKYPAYGKTYGTGAAIPGYSIHTSKNVAPTIGKTPQNFHSNKNLSKIPNKPYKFINTKGKGRKVTPSEAINKRFKSWTDSVTAKPKKEVSALVEIEQEILDAFTMFIMNDGNPIGELFKDLEEVTEQYESFNKSDVAIANSVLSKYPNMFMQFFANNEEVESPGFFIETTTDVIETMDEEAVMTANNYVSEALDTTARALEAMLDNFIKNERNG